MTDPPIGTLWNWNSALSDVQAYIGNRLSAPNGAKYKVVVDNDGNLSTELVTAPTDDSVSDEPPSDEPPPDNPSDVVFPTLTKPVLSMYQPSEPYYPDGPNYMKVSYEIDTPGAEGINFAYQMTNADETVGPYGASPPPSAESPKAGMTDGVKVRAVGNNNTYGEWSELSEPFSS